jgi:hypothetical protein
VGYQYQPVEQNPDLGLNIYVVNDRSVYQSVSYPYSYGYPGYSYGGYYGGYYGYYNYPYVNTYVTNQAILVIDLGDRKNGTAGSPRLLWEVNLGDLITSVDQTGKVLEAIDQAFVQSPYLHK